MKGSLKLYLYSSLLPLLFQREKQMLEKFLKGKAEMHHIGSSAVQGLGGKNVIDILVLAKTKKSALRLSKLIQKAGFEQRKKKKSTAKQPRLFFQKLASFKKRKFWVHLHLAWKTSRFWKDYLLFRDFLRENPKEARRYFKLKKELVERARASTSTENEARALYSDSKTKYIKRVLKKAKRDLPN